MSTTNDIQLRDPVLTIEQVAQVLQVDVPTIRYQHRMQRLRGYRLGKELRWQLSAVERFVDRYLGEKKVRQRVGSGAGCGVCG